MSSWEFAEGDEIRPGRQAVRPLGGGHRYEAWLAWDERLRALVVAKLLRPDQAEDAVARRVLAQEAAMLERLAHPLLVRSFGAEPDGRHPHLVLEFVEGPRLSTLIRRYGLILEQAVPLALNLCSVLHYLAAEGVVHLDVKPRNIIMAGSARLIDLSVAREMERLDSIRRFVGTAAYMAPEQCDPGPLRRDRAAERRLGARRDRPRGVHRRAALPAAELRAGPSAAHPPGAGGRRRAAGAGGPADVVPGGSPRRPPHGGAAGRRARAVRGRASAAQDRPLPARRKAADGTPGGVMKDSSPHPHRGLTSRA